ncbi:hypothetical protein KPSA1_06560 [Pseudomonas syringae pv. actinidiae]|uniref:Uncharacterized protein n=1 Tax=Pseudomonas syringae pv. actinidiae TaxID=103796 RepID=A0A2V0QJF4_PSESF|nr:hypothetical protein KPSA1_06560 [Pseudomonas syringae pv. actinidiae]
MLAKGAVQAHKIAGFNHRLREQARTQRSRSTTTP